MQPSLTIKAPQHAGHTLRALRAWWWLLLLAPLLAASESYWLSIQQPSIYSATATILVGEGSSRADDVNAAKLLTKTYTELITTPPIMKSVITTMQLPMTVPQLADRIEVSSTRDTTIIWISVTDTNPELAAEIATTTAQSFVTWVKEYHAEVAQRQLDALTTEAQAVQAVINTTTAELTALDDEAAVTGAPHRTVLEQDLEYQQALYRRLVDAQQAIKLAPQAHLNLVAPAAPPQDAAGLGEIRNALLTLLLTLVITVICVAGYERNMQVIRAPQDIEALGWLALLSTLPSLRKQSHVAMVSDPGSELTEAIRSLRLTLQHRVGHGPIGTILVTGPDASEGSSVVAANLAVAFAEAGQRTILVDGNLRQPLQHELFDKKNTTGFAKLLSHTTFRLDDVLQPGPLPGLQLLVAGIIARNPSDILAGDRLGGVMADLRVAADVVVIDSPSPIGVSDAQLLAAEADHVLLVAENGQTRAADLVRIGRMLNQVGALVLGAVLAGHRQVSRYRAGRLYSIGMHNSVSSGERSIAIVTPDQGAE